MIKTTYSELLSQLLSKVLHTSPEKETYKPQKTSLENLFPAGYDKRAAPPRPEAGPNMIKVNLEVLSIPHLNEKNEEIMVELRLTHRWMDERLNVSDINSWLEIEPSAIDDFWTPDSYLRHAKQENSVSLMQPPASLTVYANGEVKYSMVKMVTFSCPMSFEAFPFD